MSTPEIPGYQLDSLLLQHPLAELWHGRTFTGMEVVALVLTADGAQDAAVVDRLRQASRNAALVPGQQETPLWAANFNSTRPYAITQLVPGQTGAERLVDPLDGIIGNEDGSLQAVRDRLSGYGAVPPTTHVQMPEATTKDAESTKSGIQEYSKKLGAWVYAVIAVVVLIVFTIAYSIGTGIGSVTKNEPQADPPPEAVSPSAYPATVLLPPVPRPVTAPYKRPDGKPGLFGAVYPTNADLQIITDAELPFALGWPRPPQVQRLGESSTVILRQIVTASNYDPNGTMSLFKAQIALRPCTDLQQCLAERPVFDQQWTKIFATQVPATKKDARTWLTVVPKQYGITMTRAFQSGGHWWLVGTQVAGNPDQAADIQRVINDICHQTS